MVWTKLKSASLNQESGWYLIHCSSFRTVLSVFWVNTFYFGPDGYAPTLKSQSWNYYANVEELRYLSLATKDIQTYSWNTLDASDTSTKISDRISATLCLIMISCFGPQLTLREEQHMPDGHRGADNIKFEHTLLRPVVAYTHCFEQL